MGVQTLVSAHKKFKETHAKEYAEHFKKLAEEGQSPKTLFISCSDSRVVPSLITHTKPGELFIDRNIGNIVPPFREDTECSAVSASIEYAVNTLEVENIIVCGHTDCGACQALYKDMPASRDTVHIGRWLNFARNARDQALAMVGKQNKKTLYTATERFNIIEQLKNLMSYPTVKANVLEGKLFIQGWYYHIENGDLEYFDPIEHRFKLLEEFTENQK